MLRRLMGMAARSASKGAGGKPARRRARPPRTPKGEAARAAKRAGKKL